jgi:hypothetical protein
VRKKFKPARLLNSLTLEVLFSAPTTPLQLFLLTCHMLPCKVQAAHLAEAVIQIDGQKQKGKIKIDVQIRACYILAWSLLILPCSVLYCRFIQRESNSLVRGKKKVTEERREGKREEGREGTAQGTLVAHDSRVRSKEAHLAAPTPGEETIQHLQPAGLGGETREGEIPLFHSRFLRTKC